MKDSLSSLYSVVEHRRDNRKEDSYTCYLFDRGLDKILSKIGTEAGETIIAAKNGSRAEQIYEISDLLYHLVVLMVERGIPLEAVTSELDRRAEKIEK